MLKRDQQSAIPKPLTIFMSPSNDLDERKVNNLSQLVANAQQFDTFGEIPQPVGQNLNARSRSPSPVIPPKQAPKTKALGLDLQDTVIMVKGVQAANLKPLANKAGLNKNSMVEDHGLETVRQTSLESKENFETREEGLRVLQSIVQQDQNRVLNEEGEESSMVNTESPLHKVMKQSFNGGLKFRASQESQTYNNVSQSEINSQDSPGIA